MRKIELLSPAKNAEVGIEAINHGADAVYIGAPQFSARAAVGNSIADIQRLSDYAHRFGAKVFVALNTILNDDELLVAEKMIHEIHAAGADALIVQDMGVLQLNLPAIDLHASTQVNIQTPEKVHFLQDVGFKRVVLARELSLPEISTIYATTDVELEAFVHGSLCVSYSGLCYASQALNGRSANRGVCAQICRLPYDLLDGDKKVLVEQKHLLSLKDMDRSNSLYEMMEAGVSSFKIEGRLKDAAYVKNVVSYYRQRLDAILEQRNEFEQASYGKTHFMFDPNPLKTFRRGGVDYFLRERKGDLIQADTPKSMGEFIGRVDSIGRNNLRINTQKALSNGDGLCYMDEEAGFRGFKVNRVEDSNVVYPASLAVPQVGARLYRNYDHEFEKVLQQKTAERKLGLDMIFSETNSGFELQVAQQEMGKYVVVDCVLDKQVAQKPDQAMQNIRTQLGKLGGTIYELNNLKFNVSQAWFLPASILNDLRRKAVEAIDSCVPTPEEVLPELPVDLKTTVDETITYMASVHNKKAREFYENHGAVAVQDSYEKEMVPDAPIMTCKYCLKHELGYCSKYNSKSVRVKSPLYLRNGNNELRLHFDCKNCKMEVYLK